MDTKKNIAILGLLFVVFLYAIRCSILLDANRDLKGKCLENSRAIDSLKSEIDMQEMQISRYEIIVDIIRERNPKLAEETLHQVE